MFLKGGRCFMAKCPVERGRPAPGMHTQRRTKRSDYGVQLREKQRLRRTYGLREGPFRNLFKRALRHKGMTGERLLQLLELRLDNVVYRMGVAASRKAARLFVRHGHVRINGHKANIPSAVVKPGDVVEIHDRPAARRLADFFMEEAEGRGQQPAAWMTVDRSRYRADILREPTRDEVGIDINEQLIVELFSK